MFSGVFQCKVQCISVEEGSRHEVSASVVPWPGGRSMRRLTGRHLDPSTQIASSRPEPVTLSQLNAKANAFLPISYLPCDPCWLSLSAVKIFIKINGKDMASS
jgi:hypothetical protein